MGFRCSAASAPSCGLVPLLFLFLFLRAALRGLCLLSGRAFLFSGPSCPLSLTSSATGSLVVSLFLMLGFFSCSETLVSLPITPSFFFVLLSFLVSLSCPALSLLRFCSLLPLGLTLRSEAFSLSVSCGFLLRPLFLRIWPCAFPCQLALVALACVLLFVLRLLRLLVRLPLLPARLSASISLSLPFPLLPPPLPLPLSFLPLLFPLLLFPLLSLLPLLPLLPPLLLLLLLLPLLPPLFGVGAKGD